MTGCTHPLDEVVASAVIDAVLAARWETINALSLSSSEGAKGLLLVHAAELATSPFARDQLLKLALKAAALDLEVGKTPLQQGAMFFFGRDTPSEDDRKDVQRHVLSQHGVAVFDTEPLIVQFENRRAPEFLASGELSLSLSEEARLQASLWDDPRLSIDPQVRLIMLSSVPRFLQRAAELDPRGSRAMRKNFALWAEDRSFQPAQHETGAVVQIFAGGSVSAGRRSAERAVSVDFATPAPNEPDPPRAA